MSVDLQHVTLKKKKKILGDMYTPTTWTTSEILRNDFLYKNVSTYTTMCVLYIEMFPYVPVY